MTSVQPTYLFGKNFIFTDRKENPTIDSNIVWRGKNLLIKQPASVIYAPSFFYGYSQEGATALSTESTSQSRTLPSMITQVNFYQSADKKQIVYTGPIEKYFRFILLTTTDQDLVSSTSQLKTFIKINGVSQKSIVNEVGSSAVLRQFKYYALFKLKEGDVIESYYNNSVGGSVFNVYVANHQLAIIPI